MGRVLRGGNQLLDGKGTLKNHLLKVKDASERESTPSMAETEKNHEEGINSLDGKDGNIASKKRISKANIE